MGRAFVVPVVIAALLALASGTAAKVLRVGSYLGVRGQFASIQGAVKAAKPGDWILIGPGDYKTRPSSIRHPKGHPNFPAGILITTRHLHMRGMNRNTVIVDGTKPGSRRCSRAGSAQNFGAAGAEGHSVGGYARTAATPTGANGLMVFKAANVSIENLTACNFLGGSADAGNAIWWNGGAHSFKVGGYGFHGAYLTTTSTYLKNRSRSGEFSAAQYGVFSSNWSGGTWDHIYASNFNDSGFYIGACRQICNQTMNHAWSEYNALGYSGSNSGGRLVIENSEFDNNQDGFDTNSQNGDEPSPQNGACPNNGVSPITHTHSCWVFVHNFVHDNNNPNVPSSGGAAAGPVGTGMSVSGGRNDTVIDNRFVNNNAWGVILVGYPDSGRPCIGGTMNSPAFGHGSCLFEGWGDALLNNTFGHNGSYGHPSNGDFAKVNLESGHPTDCYRGNTELGGGSLTPGAALLQLVHPVCDGSPGATGSEPSTFISEVLCDTRVGAATACPTGTYPVAKKIVMHALPKSLKSMPNPCRDVPRNPWCIRLRP